MQNLNDLWPICSQTFTIAPIKDAYLPTYTVVFFCNIQGLFTNELFLVPWCSVNSKVELDSDFYPKFIQMKNSNNNLIIIFSLCVWESLCKKGKKQKPKLKLKPNKELNKNLQKLFVFQLSCVHVSTNE